MKRLDPPAMKKQMSLTAHRAPKTMFESRLGRWFGFDRLLDLHAKAPHSLSASEFSSFVFNEIGANYQISEYEFERIPATGSLVVVSNHPYGALDGLVLCDLLLRRREDVKVISNYLLQKIAQLRSILLAVDPFGGEGSNRRSSNGLRQGIQWLENGGALALFPAGTVAHYQFKHAKVTDPVWKTTAAGLIHRCQPTVLPVHMSGYNSSFFQLAAMLHPKLRTALLPRELLNKGNHTVKVKVGRPMSYAEISFHANRDALTDHLRSRVFNLASN